jgi:hypothetical protein
MTISKHDDVIDSREIVERVAELASWSECTVCGEQCDVSQDRGYKWLHVHSGDVYCGTGDGATASPTILDEDESAELVTLRALLSQLETVGGDSPEDGQTLVRDSYFVNYAQELAEELGLLESESGTTNGWPFYCIDWEQAARELRMDYTSVEFDGVTYWVR